MITNDVGERIRSIRYEKGLSQEKLSLISGVDRTYIASVERGNRNISIITLEKIVVALGYSMEAFFKGM